MDVTSKWTKGMAAAWRPLALAGLLATGLPGLATAQSAIIYGALSNFDISNDTGQICHGFEVKMDGVQIGHYGGSFTANRYGNPTVSATATGIAVTWKSPQDAATGAWQTRTLPHTVPWFPGQCYLWVAGTYENGGCEHFGTYTTANPTRVTSRWLCEDSTDRSALVAVDPPTAVPYASYWVEAPVQPNDPPQLVAEIAAPEPADAPSLYGDAQWTRTYKVELQRALSLDELVADNVVVPGDLAQLESDYQVLQDEPASGGNGRRGRHRNQGNIDPTTRAVVRRIEVYAFTGQYDPITHEALCADLLCDAPAPDEIGELLDVQMTAANVQPDALIVTRVGNGNVDSTDRLLSCGNKCAQPYAAGAVVTLTTRAGSDSTFSGWTGACAGTAATCTVTVNGAINVGATFALIPRSGGGGGGGTSGGGGGGDSSRYTLQIGRSNAGTVTATPSGDKAIRCGKDCSARYSGGTVVTLTATPPAGQSFLGWGGACSGTATTCVVTMSDNRSVQATFSR